MGAMGFRTDVPRNWNRWWLAMWGVVSIGLLAAALAGLPFWPWWLLAAAIGFGVPELVSVLKEDDSLPPLTHTIRHFVPNWVAFPLIYFLLGTIGARWLEFPRPFHLGALFGLLGWLTDHFAVTYTKPDPYPYSGEAAPEPKKLAL